MRGVLPVLLCLGAWVLCAQGLLVPTRGRVHLVTSLPQHNPQLAAIESALSGADVTKSNFQRNLRKLCDAASTLRSVSSDDLIVVVGDVIDGFCDSSTIPGSFIQVAFGGETIQSLHKTSRSFYPRSGPKSKNDLNSVLKSMFWDVMMDNILHGGNIDINSIKANPRGFFNNLFSGGCTPAWFSASIGGALAFLFMSYYQPVGHSVEGSSDTKQIQEELESLKPAELRQMAKVEYTGFKTLPITPDDFRKYMKLTTELLIDYFIHPEVYTVTTKYIPGFIHQAFSKLPPTKPEPFKAIISDIYSKLLPGMTHWQHPRFHAYFATGCSYPDILADTIVSGFGIVSFNWDSSPAYAELEVGIVNWLGRIFNLPESMLFQGTNTETSKGGGAFQDSASDCVLAALLAARHKRILEIANKSAVVKEDREKEHEAITKLVCYASEEAHSCIEKAALLALVHMRSVKGNEKLQLTGAQLEKDIKKDLDRGLIPFFVHVTCGTTGTGAFDRLDEVVVIARKYNLWVHVDGAYGGTSWLLPELRHTQAGIEEVDSININLHKIFLHSSSASVLWTRHQADIKNAFNVDPPYLTKRYPESTDFRNFGIPLTRRQRCMKTWFVLRMYGVDGMKDYIKRLIANSKRMHEHLARDPRLEIIGENTFTVSAFRLKASDEKLANDLTKALHGYICNSLKLAVTFAHPGHKSAIRISISHQMSLDKEIDESYALLSDLIEEFLLLSSKSNVSNGRFIGDVGVIGSPNLSTQSTMSGISAVSPVNRTESFVQVKDNNNGGVPDLNKSLTGSGKSSVLKRAQSPRRK